MAGRWPSRVGLHMRRPPPSTAGRRTQRHRPSPWTSARTGGTGGSARPTTSLARRARPRRGLSVTTAIPPVFEAYAPSTRRGCRLPTPTNAPWSTSLVACTPDQPWWLGSRHRRPRRRLSARSRGCPSTGTGPIVLVEAGPEQALGRRVRSHARRRTGSLPDLFFPADRSWLVSALWDDIWTDIGASAAILAALRRNPLVNARPRRARRGRAPARPDARLTPPYDGEGTAQKPLLYINAYIYPIALVVLLGTGRGLTCATAGQLSRPAERPQVIEPVLRFALVFERRHRWHSSSHRVSDALVQLVGPAEPFAVYRR